MKRHILYGLILLLVTGMMLTTCHKEYFNLDSLITEMEFEPAIVAPVIYGRFDMSDLAGVMDSVDYSLEDQEGEAYYLVFTDTIFTWDDTLDFNFGLEEDRVTHVQLNFNSVNEMPIEWRLQVYMEDSTHMVLDSVFDNLGIILGPSQVDSDGRLIEVSGDENSSTFDADKIAILDDIAYLRMNARSTTIDESAEIVKIYAAYALNYKISLSAKIKVNTSD